MKQFQTVDQYISSFPSDIQNKLIKIRQLIKATVPEAVEAISYGMPGYKLNGHPLVYFAGNKEHIGFYPVPSGIAAFRQELAPYISGKGTAKFPYDQPIPYGLIKKIVKFRMAENLAAYPKKKSVKK